MVQHADIDHSGLTGVGGTLTVEDEGTPLATAATTLDFVGAGVTASGTGAEKTITIPGGASLTGMIPILTFPAFLLSPATTDNTASRGIAFPVVIPGTMRIRAAAFRVTATGSGTHEWGLFDYSSNAASCTKLAGGSAALGATGWTEIAAASAPVTVSPGNYMMIFKWPAANAATISTAESGASNAVVKFIAGYSWDDTPDLTTSWANHTRIIIGYLRGDLNASATW